MVNIRSSPTSTDFAASTSSSAAPNYIQGQARDMDLVQLLLMILLGTATHLVEAAVDTKCVSLVCSSSAYEPGGVYAKAVQTALNDVVSYSTPATYNYRSTFEAEDGQRVFTEGICIPPLVVQKECTECINFVAQNLLTNQRCGPARSGARSRATYCAIRYENFDFNDTILSSACSWK